MIARAIAIRCLCPPERRYPPSPTNVSQLLGSASMKSNASAITANGSTISATEIGYLNGVTSEIQTQIYSASQEVLEIENQD